MTPISIGRRLRIDRDKRLTRQREKKMLARMLESHSRPTPANCFACGRPCEYDSRKDGDCCSIRERYSQTSTSYGSFRVWLPTVASGSRTASKSRNDRYEAARCIGPCCLRTSSWYRQHRSASRRSLRRQTKSRRLRWRLSQTQFR